MTSIGRCFHTTHLRQRADKGHDADAGFTLVEVLVALAILALIAVLISESLRGAQRALVATQRAMTEASIEPTRAYLMNLFAETRPIVMTYRDNGRGVFFQGLPSSMTLVSSHTVAAQYGGLYVSTIEVVKADDGADVGDVVLRQRLYRPSDGQSDAVSGISDVVLVPRVAGLTFRYFGSKEGVAGKTWAEQWVRHNRLPNLVAMDIRFPDGDRRAWPTLAATLMLADP